MSYCRFRNTVRDLQDCYNSLEDELEGEEKEAKERLVELCRDIARETEED